MDALGDAFVAVPGGTVVMRDSWDGDRAREVRLQPFKMSRVTLTAHEWRDGALAGDRDGQDLPAASVTWNAAVAWCNEASGRLGLETPYRVVDGLTWWEPSSNGLRLPTVAEWEYACRAGSAGHAYGALSDVAWTVGDEVSGVQPVGLKRPNAWGLHDMLGNVWEWCWDYADPARYLDYRVFKGGAWRDEPWSVRVGTRRGSAPNAVLEDVGFRVAQGAVTATSEGFQGWSPDRDRHRAAVRGPLPMGWTPLRELVSRPGPQG